MNKLAVLAFALLSFFSFMLWYLANNSLNDHLKSQVILQSKYYSLLDAQLMSADFSKETGILAFSQYQLTNAESFNHPLFISIDTINAQLAKQPTRQLDSPSIQKKTTTLVHIESLKFSNVAIWIEKDSSGISNVEQTLKQVRTHLAIDYPALYPEFSAELYAKKHPDRNETAILASQPQENQEVKEVETNQAIIASKAAKQEKRLLGKALTRVKIDAIIIDTLTLHTVHDGQVVTTVLNQVSLDALGNKKGLATNQLGGEILRRLLDKLVTL